MTGCAAIIPARYASTRLPGKPLLKETGKYLIQHVYERLLDAKKIDRILVATDDKRILDAVRSFGCEAVMTSKDHPSGSDRVAEACLNIDADIILNVQGDEPDVAPSLIDRLVECITSDDDCRIATAATPIRVEASLSSPHVVKTVLDETGNALYFSRAPIPYNVTIKNDPPPLKHVGVYAFRKSTLLKLTNLPPTSLEKIEKLEQLRALYNGMAIRVLITDKDHLGIDTREEYDAFIKKYIQNQA